MRCGYFDDEHREYVITDPRTPVKWINYIGALSFGGFVDHTGGALICRGDPSYNRITRYVAQMPAGDFRGETLYLRLRLDGDYRVYCPFFTPARQPLERFECHIGLGYTRIVSEFAGLRCAVTIFVPLGEERELRDLRVTNLSSHPQTVDVVPVVEYSHFDALKQFTNADWVPQTMQSRLWESSDGVRLLLQYPFMNRDRQVNYFTASLPFSSFESDRRAFLGDNEYGSWTDPLALHHAELACGQANRGDNIAALLIPLGVLAPGQTRRVITQLGQVASAAEALRGVRSYSDPAAVDGAFASLAEHWSAILAALQVRTPDAEMDRMLNIHNPRQCVITRTWSRYLSLYQLGYGGDRGIGFRDSAQDTLGVMASQPDDARELLAALLAYQRPDGAAMHQFNPATGQASMGDARERPDHPQYYSDDHLWAVLAAAAYVKETGDRAFLDRMIPFYAPDAGAQRKETASVLDHLRRALAFTAGDTGSHGLPLLGFADWNDTVNLAAGAESLFTACLYGKALLEMADLLTFLGDSGEAQQYRSAHAAMRRRFNAAGWDGEWYLAYFDHDGSPLGSRRNSRGQIYLNSQTWAVIAGFAPPRRARLALDAAFRRLSTAFGLKLSAPGYDGYDPAVGGITTYPPGAKENGGVFLHTNPWAIIAETMLGNGERAYRYYRQINPAARNEQIEVYECEPYAYPQNILGDEHPNHGLARNTWLTGTAAWSYHAATQYILGVRPEFAGLRVDPCIPPGWAGFSLQRRFRGALYSIEVDNSAGVGRGVVDLLLDGRRLEGSLLPPQEPGSEHRVQVRLGKTGAE